MAALATAIAQREPLDGVAAPAAARPGSAAARPGSAAVAARPRTATAAAPGAPQPPPPSAAPAQASAGGLLLLTDDAGCPFVRPGRFAEAKVFASQLAAPSGGAGASIPSRSLAHSSGGVVRPASSARRQRSAQDGCDAARERHHPPLAVGHGMFFNKHNTLHHPLAATGSRTTSPAPRSRPGIRSSSTAGHQRRAGKPRALSPTTVAGVDAVTGIGIDSSARGAAGSRPATATWERWAVGSPGRAAAEEATRHERTYSSGPRRGGAGDTQQQQQQQQQRAASSSLTSSPAQRPFSAVSRDDGGGGRQQGYRHYTTPTPSIPGVRARMAAGGGGGLINGRAFLGDAAVAAAQRHDGGAGRPGSAVSSAGVASPRSASSLPARRVITAELAALRQRYVAASGTDHSKHGSGSGSRGRDAPQHQQRPDGNVSPAGMRSQLDALLGQINAAARNGGRDTPDGVRVVDLTEGGGAAGAATAGSSSPPSRGRIPPQLRHEAIVRRAAETTRLLRKEDRASMHVETTIRNFRVSALVGSTSGRLMDPGRVKETLEYFDEFYEMIATPTAAQSRFLNSCVGPR